MMITFLSSVIGVCEEGDVRLQGGRLETEGRVEICINETWSTICDNGWSINDANVVCQQLGFLSIGKVYTITIIIVEIKFTIDNLRGCGTSKCTVWTGHWANCTQLFDLCWI